MKNALQLDHAIACPNCNTLIAGNFCQGCGQAAHLHVPSAREFIHEFIAHYVALEGKLWKSMALLLFRPGRLTRDYIEGKRARHIEPLRLYLTFSIIFFAIFKLGDNNFGNAAPQTPPAQEASSSAQTKDAADARVAAARPAKKKNDSVIELDEGDEQWLKTKSASIHPALGKKVEQFGSLTDQERGAALKRAFFSYAPYAIFLLMPVFAGLLKLLYLGSGRRYGEHVLFALHTNAFAFLTLSLVLIVPDFIPLVGAALMLWLVFYLPTAMRKVYGGGRVLTALRWVVLMSMHLLCSIAAVVAAAALAVVA